MTYDEYLEAVRVALKDHPRWRVGQTHFNVLYQHRPDISEPIRGGPVDPFHDDSKLSLDTFLEKVKKNW